MRLSVSDYHDQWENIGVLSKPVNPTQMAKSFEAEVYGDRDGRGLRFWIPALYILGGDLPQAKMSIDRHVKTYSNESTLASPLFIASALLVSIREYNSCKVHNTGGILLRRMQAANTHLASIILGREVSDRTVSYLTNHTHYEFAASFPAWFYELWSSDDKAILAEAVDTVFNKVFLASWIEFINQLKGLGPGDKRSRIIREQDYFLSLMIEEEFDEWCHP